MRAYFQHTLIRGAAVLVPAAERAEWLSEWCAELAYVPAYRRTAFCLGAYADAAWMRLHSPLPRFQLVSPWRCLALLAALALLSVWSVIHRPALREVLFPPRYAESRRLVTAGSVSWSTYERLAGKADGAFSATAFYFPRQVHFAPRGRYVDLAFASRNLFAVLGVPVAGTADSAASLVLSQRTWRDIFGADPLIVGRPVVIEGQPAHVTAVISDQLWNLPGRVDAWLLLPDAQLAAFPEDKGVLVGRTTSPVTAITVPNGDGTDMRYRCSPVREPQPLAALFFVLAMALMVVSPARFLPFHDLPASRVHLPFSIRMRRWTFLGAKILLATPIALFGSIAVLSVISTNLQAHGLFLSCVLGLRWIFADQRRRCPVCLRVLTDPMSVGEASHTFLHWYGTEFVCRRGHGLLHMPEIATSYSAPRWLPLDSSWSSLFS